MVLLKAGIAIAILALIAYAWRKNLKKRKETEELLKIEEEFLASMAHEREGRIFTMADVEKDLPQDAEEDWEPMMMQPEEHKCNCGHCHHEEENHECHCGEEGHECQWEECHCHQENQEEEIEIKEEDIMMVAELEEIVFINKGASSSKKYHSSPDAHHMDGAEAMSRSRAEEEGYEPCGKCFKK